MLDTASLKIYFLSRIFIVKPTATKKSQTLGATLSLAHCRQVLGPDCRLSDEQVLLLRDQLLALATLLVDTYLEETAQGLTWSSRARAWIQPN